MRGSAFIFAVFAIGCGADDRATPELPELDYDEFVLGVQPVLAARCGNPTSCHGIDHRPFAIYSRHAYRADARDIYADPPLTEDELRSNYDRTRSFAIDFGSGALLLTKPLDGAISGVSHVGGIQFTSTEEREYLVIESWIAP